MDEQSSGGTKAQANLAPTALVVFGATGNLVQKKLLPALYHLLEAGRLPEQAKIVFVVRDDSSLEHMIEQTEINLLRQEHDCNPDVLKKLGELSQVLRIDSVNPDHYIHLTDLLDKLDEAAGLAYNRLFYLAIPPDILRTVIGNLGASGLNKETDGRRSRILVEKPFGTDLANARELVEYMSRHFAENQVYRIDHYLAKETAQNILVFRVNNPLIDDIWGRQFIDHIQITAAEMIGIEARSNFYEQMGALRDIVQSHLLQLMTLIMMEIPEELDAAGIHSEKLELLNNVTIAKAQHVDEISARGQYKNYRQEAGNPNSNVETYAALKLEVANSRWGGVPVLLRTGKQLASKITEINVVFKDRSRRKVTANLLTIRIQPNEGISLTLTAKKPGFEEALQPVQMDFRYQTSFDNTHPDAYERVLVDAIAGDQTLFASSQEVLRCWEILDPVLTAWKNSGTQPEVYQEGSWGPGGADALAAEFGTEWFAGSTHTSSLPPSNKSYPTP